MIQVDRDNMIARAQVSAKARALIANVCRGNFDCGRAFESDYDEYQTQYVVSVSDETALFSYIAELESKISGA